MQIDFSDEHSANADSSIRVSLELDSKVNTKSEVQEEKHILPRISTQEGIHIDPKEEEAKKADCSI
jgi:hypothetical protein